MSNRKAKCRLLEDTQERKLGFAIRRWREAKGLSQERFAERAGLHRTYISQIERGLKSPSIRVLSRIADALGSPSASASTAGNITVARSDPCAASPATSISPPAP